MKLMNQCYMQLDELMTEQYIKLHWVHRKPKGLIALIQSSTCREQIVPFSLFYYVTVKDIASLCQENMIKYHTLICSSRFCFVIWLFAYKYSELLVWCYFFTTTLIYASLIQRGWCFHSHSRMSLANPLLSLRMAISHWLFVEIAWSKGLL